MSAAKHTPGPWKAVIGAYGDWFINANDGSAWIAKTVPVRDLMTKLAIFETEPDARLIAAAPDLLAALEAMSTSFHDVEYMGGPDDHKTIAANMARAAIAKATGSEP